MTQILNPTVSVIIAAYNRPEYLRDALKSVVNQTYPIHEIIVVDDCSSIQLQSVVDEFPDFDILYFKKDKNLGVSNSRNVGIQKSTGDWIAFLDDDDYFLPNKIQSNVNDIMSSNYCAVLCSYKILETGEVLGQHVSKVVCYDDLKKGNSLCGASGFFAKREYLVVEQFDESIPLGEDWDIYIRLMSFGDIYFNSSILFLYRKGHDSITSSAKKLRIDNIEPYTRSSYKHREWLGEKNFRRRLAYQLLGCITVKEEKLSWIMMSIKLAGLKATIFVLYKRVIAKLYGEKYFTV
jgi:glycosyltransferase involved in cell wall biosynthesis